MTTQTLEDFTLLPQIIVGTADHNKLIVLALADTGRAAQEADDLLNEMERARVVTDAAVPANVVRMGSAVRYRAENGPERLVTLVYPVDADIAAGRVSVLTPVGTALIGLSTGQSIAWHTRDGRQQVLTVLEVTPPRQ